MIRIINNNIFVKPNQTPMMTNKHCCHNMYSSSMFGFGFPQAPVAPCSGGSDKGFGKALLWGSVAGIGAGLIIGFAKPIGKAFCWLGRGIGKAAKWTWNSVLKPAGKGIAKAASWLWNKALKPAGQAIGKAAKWVWNGITGIFKKKDKAETS